VRIGFDGGEDQVLAGRLAGVLAGAGRGLHDDRGVDFSAAASHDGLHLLEIVDVEGGMP
jgi:hypothetical protein